MIENEWIPNGSILEIVIAVTNPTIAFNLVGEVRWSAPENDDCSIGLVLLQEGDFSKWVEHFPTLFTEEP